MQQVVCLAAWMTFANTPMKFAEDRYQLRLLAPGFSLLRACLSLPQMAPHHPKSCPQSLVTMPRDSVKMCSISLWSPYPRYWKFVNKAPRQMPPLEPQAETYCCRYTHRCRLRCSRQPSNLLPSTSVRFFYPFGGHTFAYETNNLSSSSTGSDQARFKFAKDAIELRKRGIARGNGEETVVLAFGGNFGGSAVHVTRKLRKRPLWKVNS